MHGGHQHRSGGLKQSNKKHKSRGRLATKRSIKRQEGGKVSSAGAGGAAHRPGNKQTTVERDIRSERLNKARQLKEKKRDELYLQRRTGSSEGPPLVVALVGLSPVSDTAAVQEAYLKTADLVAPAPPMQIGGVPQKACGVSAAFQTSKQRFTFLLPGFSVTAALEAAGVADVVMFVVNVAHEEGCVSEEGDSILSGIRAQGLPGVVGIIQGLDSISSHKVQADMRRYGHRFFETEFGEKAKVADASNSVQMLRALSTASSAVVHWRANRSYVLADDVKWEGQTDNPEVGTLRLRGYVRGRPLSVNQLLHVPNVGTFRMRVITKVGTEPCSLKNRPKSSAGMAVESQGEEEVVLAQAEPKLQEELEMLAEPDHMMGEQTWPTEEEEEAARMDGAWDDDADDEEGPEKGEGKTKKKRLLKKMSEYQASWFLGEEGVDDEEHGDDDDAAAPEEEEDEGDDGSDDGMMTEDFGAASVMSKKPKRELSDREKQELEFPDEVDTPQDIPARTRFARYRALKSFRTSPWDPKESLPRDYARIFQFQNFPRACARVVAEHDEVERLQNQALLSSKRVTRGGGSCAASVVSMDVTGEEGAAKGSTTEVAEQALAAQYQGYVASGVYVTVHVPDVPLQAYQHGLQASAGPLMAFSLLRYENKISVLHFNIQKHIGAADVSIKSKDRLVFHTGFRTFEGRPVFSDNNLNCDKHKFMRFLHAGRFAVASVYGPVTVPPCPLLMFKETRNEQGILEGRQLIATGTLATVDPNRIVLKRIVLTGYPVRAKKRSAVVKHMFYNPDDVRWFKPAELSTKLGAMGHIREPVGTHGLMKVRFNRVINQSDTVCLPLYKRVYPKFLQDTPEAEQ